MSKENLHQKYWKKMTVYSTYEYCRKMLTLSSDPYQKVSPKEFEEKCKNYVSKLIDYNNQGILVDKISEIKDLSPFPNDICGVLYEHTTGTGIFQPKHLMCKLGTLKMDDIFVEFLIEYGILESDVEIYYGIKAIANEQMTSDAFAEKVFDISKEWFDYMKESNKSSGYMGIDVNEHKFTNNINDGTFWISWVRMESKTTMYNVVDKLHTRIYRHFTKFLDKKDIQYQEPLELSDKSKPLIDSKAERTLEYLNKNNGAIRIPKDDKDSKRMEYIAQRLECACNWKDDEGNGLLTKKGDLYYFNVDNTDAAIILKLLFKPTKYIVHYTLAKELYATKDTIRIDDYKDHIKNRLGVKQLNDLESHANKETLDRKLIQKTVRNHENKKLSDSCLKKRVALDDAKIFNRINKLVGRFNMDNWINQELENIQTRKERPIKIPPQKIQ